jgi:hypothetical protein
MFQMLPESETDFFFVTVESKVHFDVAADGKVNKVVVRLEGGELSGPKVK